LAEVTGFEPVGSNPATDGLANHCHKPLDHTSVILAGKRGIEPRTERLTAVCSTSELYAKIHPTVTLCSFRWRLSSRTFDVVAEYTFIKELKFLRVIFYDNLNKELRIFVFLVLAYHKNLSTF